MTEMESSSTHFTSIPTIDLSRVSEHKPELLNDLRHALLNIGFLYVSNHGVPNDIITNLVDALPELFSLSDDAKEQVALHNSPHFLGYSSTGAETTAGKTDQREQFEFATELLDTWSEGMPLADRLRGPNQVSRKT